MTIGEPGGGGERRTNGTDGTDGTERGVDRADHRRVPQVQRVNTSGENVIYCKLIRDRILAHLNPWKLKDLQCVLELRCYEGLLSDVDLKEVYFQGLWGFREEDFVLRNWETMSVAAIRECIMEALPFFRAHTSVKGKYAFPATRADPFSMRTKEELMKGYGALAYVPVKLYMKALGSVAVMKKLKSEVWMKVLRRDWRQAYADLKWVCGMNVDHGIIRKLADLCKGVDFVFAADEAARCSHLDVLELLVEEYGAVVDVGTLTRAAEGGHNDLIDDLVEDYGLNPDGLNAQGWTALQWATMCNKVHTVKHLVDTYDVDVHYVKFGRNCLQDAERRGFVECADVLRRYMEERPVPRDARGRPIIREEV